MKSITVLTCLLVFIISIAGAQSCPKPVPLDKNQAIGLWKGSYSFNGSLEEIIVEFTETEGALKSFVTISKHGMKKVEFNTRICDSHEIHFKAPVGKLGFEFVGKLKVKALTGTIIVRDLTGIVGEEVFALKK